MVTRFIVTEREKRWLGGYGVYTHLVRDSENHNAVLCAAPIHCAELIADALNFSVTPFSGRKQ